MNVKQNPGLSLSNPFGGFHFVQLVQYHLFLSSTPGTPKIENMRRNP